MADNAEKFEPKAEDKFRVKIGPLVNIARAHSKDAAERAGATRAAGSYFTMQEYLDGGGTGAGLATLYEGGFITRVGEATTSGTADSAAKPAKKGG